MNSASDVKRFVLEANSAFKGKSASRKMNFLTTIKELDDAKRKTLLKIIQNPQIAESEDIKFLADGIAKTKSAEVNGTFAAGREVGLWARICRLWVTICNIWDNLFNGRTRSSDVVKTIENLSERHFEDPGLINTLPQDLILTIFEKCKTALPALAKVNHLWKQITGKDEFYTAMFSPAFASLCFGKADLKTHFEMDLGTDDVPHLHLEDYGAVEEGLCLLTYFPKEIPIKDRNGVISFVPPRAKLIGKIVKTPKCGNKTQFAPISDFSVINMEREIKGGEWVVTYKNPIGLGKTFKKQVALAEKQGKDTNVAEFEKTIYAVFMHYVKTGERCFSRGPPHHFLGIRFREKTDYFNNLFIFGISGLEVSNFNLYGHVGLGVAAQRKSIGS